MWLDEKDESESHISAEHEAKCSIYFNFQIIVTDFYKWLTEKSNWYINRYNSASVYSVYVRAYTCVGVLGGRVGVGG